MTTTTNLRSGRRRRQGHDVRAVADRSRSAAGARRAVLSLYGRLIRRGLVLMAAALAVYAALEVVSYRSAYPDGMSPAQFRMLEDNPAVRMMNGVPSALDSAGGFAVWDAGWMLQLLLAIWAILTTTRLLRGEEDLGRADLVLAGPVRSSRASVAAQAVVGAGGLLLGGVVALTLLASGEAVGGSLLLGLALAGVCATFAAVAAVTSQLVEVRRRAAGLAAGVLGLAYVLRMIGSSSDGRLWVRWLTPLGWLDELRPFGDSDLRALVPLLVVPFVLAWFAVALRGRRDVGRALLFADVGRQARLRGLGGPTVFAWRSNLGVLVAWVLGLGTYAAVMGALVSTMIDWLGQDQGYQKLLADLGLDQALTAGGFIAMIGVFFGVAVAVQAAWRLGAARTEEEAGRAEALLARPVTRMRWLGGHALLSLLGAVLLLAVVGTGLWAGAAASGSSEIAVTDTLRASFNTLPVVVLVAGLTLCTFGLLPRLTVAVPVTVTVVAFLVSLLGPALSWPAWALDLSPFTHLAQVPAQPWAATPAIVMACLGLALAAAGLAAFRRRDVVGT